jgi:hypothetical protein
MTHGQYSRLDHLPHSASDKADLFQSQRSGDSNALHHQAIHSLSSKHSNDGQNINDKQGKVSHKSNSSNAEHTNGEKVALVKQESKHLPHLQIVDPEKAPDRVSRPIRKTEQSEEKAQAQSKNPEKALDSKKAIVELVKVGRIVDKTADRGLKAPDRKLEEKAADDKTPAKISVALQNIDGSPRLKSHFSIKENGQIEMNGNPETSNPKEIKIVLERKEGQLNPTDAQSKAADNLVSYLSERLKAGNDQARLRGLELDDRDSVVSPEVEQKQHLRPKKELANFTAETRHSVEQTQRFHGANGVDMPRAATERMGSFNTREVPRQPAESSRLMAIKESIAGLWKPDEKAPYDTVRRHPDGGYRVGRYGFSGQQLQGFLKALGEPPDPALLDKLIKEGKLPKDFAEMLKNPEFLAKLNDMAAKMQKGEAPAQADLKLLLPKETQEAIESSLIDQAQRQVGDRPGSIAAAMLSGKAVADMSKADVITAEGRQLSQAADRLYDIATRRANTESSGDTRSDVGRVGVIPQGRKRELIEEALAKAGVPASLANISAVNLIVQRESSWNPNIVNTWDSNARKGTPSKGLMQTIGPTFNSYSIPGHKNIFNPVDNMIAGIRYSVSRYGSLQNVPGVRAVARGGAYRGY